MAEIPTFQELYDAAKAEIQSRQPNLTDFVEGSVLDGITGAGAVLADEVARVAVDLFAALFFDTAQGADLDTLALDRLGLPRLSESTAVGNVVWTRGTGIGTYVIPGGTRFQGTVGDETITLTSTGDVTLDAVESTVDVPVTADLAGRDGNLAAGVIDTVLDVVGADIDATATNETIAGGAPAETDEQFRDRCRRYYSTLRRGTADALVTGALSVAGVSYAWVDESEAQSSQVVYVYVGDPDANSNQALADAVDAELDNWRAAGIQVIVLGSTREEIALALTIVVERGSDVVRIEADIKTVIVAYGDTLQPSIPARLSRIEKAAHDAADEVIAAQVTSHLADIEPTASQNALRFTVPQITLTFVEA